MERCATRVTAVVCGSRSLRDYRSNTSKNLFIVIFVYRVAVRGIPYPTKHSRQEKEKYFGMWIRHTRTEKQQQQRSILSHSPPVLNEKYEIVIKTSDALRNKIFKVVFSLKWSCLSVIVGVVVVRFC